MATVSSHTLNGVDGTHAGGIDVTLSRIAQDGSRAPVFETETDSGGRVNQEINPEEIDPAAVYELVLATGPYWAARGLSNDIDHNFEEIVLRFRMLDGQKKYHLPIILSPNSYSTWLSG